MSANTNATEAETKCLTPTNEPLTKETEEKGEMIEVSKQTHGNRKKAMVICLTAVIMVVIVSLFAVFMNMSTVAEDNDEIMDDENGVLPNTTFKLASNTNVMIAGEFIADGTRYEFKSVSNETSEFIEFMVIGADNAEALDFTGFRFSHFNASNSLLFELYTPKNDGSLNIEIAENKSPSNNTQILELFIQDIICFHFVELSLKLGSLGYVGSDSHAIHDIHSFAQWIFKHESDGVNTEQWVCYCYYNVISLCSGFAIEYL